ncbi:MAG: selenium-dependent molybdenum cofactor biosynthesis protein YqeB [Chloroflexota bacterium]
MSSVVLLRGSGDLGSGVALRLHRAGLQVVITELPQPLVIRRLVSFAEAVYQGEFTVEGVRAKRVTAPEEVFPVLTAGEIPVLIDPQLRSLDKLKPSVLVDARMTKTSPDVGRRAAPLVIGLGPGFVAGENCHAVIETKRGHFLGRVYWQGTSQPNTGVPEAIAGHDADRVLRSPAEGQLIVHAQIGDILDAGDLIAEVGGKRLQAPFHGVLRGMLHAGVQVHKGMKIGDLDPRADPRYCTLVSDKALAIGGGVLEAILSRPDLHARLWDPG